MTIKSFDTEIGTGKKPLVRVRRGTDTLSVLADRSKGVKSYTFSLESEFITVKGKLG